MTIPPSLLARLLALSLVLTTATQLRMPRLPIGPGELLLVIFLFGASFKVFTCWASQRFTSHNYWILCFWICSSIAMLFGALHSYQENILKIPLFLHDSAAYAFVCCLSVILSFWDLNKAHLLNLSRFLVA